MSIEAATAIAGMCFSYLLRFAAAYLFVQLFCRFVKDPQIRFRLWGIFLAGMVVAGLELLVLSAGPALTAPASAKFAGASDAHWLWTFTPVVTARFATVVSRLRWAYVLLVAILLLRFSARFWQLRILLRSSQPVSEAVLSLFESVRSEMQAPYCELRAVPGLGSPAATGWLHPRILLPAELWPRLETLPLADIFRHELMHVRRRDYLWDRLAALGCCAIFFHPVAWLVRRRLRWERELICDQGVVERSSGRRLEYATCLTTLANWRFSPEQFATPVDFLSPPSLLATRVGALVSPARQTYSPYQRAAVSLSTAIALTLPAWLMPEVAIVPWEQPRVIAADDPTIRDESPSEPEPIPQAQTTKRDLLPATDMIAPDIYVRLAASNPPVSEHPSVPEPKKPLAQPETQPHSNSSATPVKRKLIARLGSWAVRSVKLGVSKVESPFERRRHKKPATGQALEVARNAPGARPT
jgi:beta-lactamase regulating signal transducer with metallopeptidase domain